MSTVTKLTNSTGAYRFQNQATGVIPTDLQQNGMVNASATALSVLSSTDFTVQPGAQSTVLPTWLAGDPTASPVVPPLPFYSTLLAAGALTVTTS